MERFAVVAGATGLVGGHLVAALLATDRYARVSTLVRGEFAHPDARVEVRKVDFPALDSASIPQGATDAFCTLGTTIKIAGSEAAFRGVDFDAVVRFAQAARDAGVHRFHVVSAMGADADSRVFYNRVKGEMERAVSDIGFASVHIHRPSLLLGDRKAPRLGERVGAVALAAFRPLLGGRLAKYRAIEARVVANAMVAFADEEAPGVQVHFSDALQARGAR